MSGWLLGVALWGAASAQETLEDAWEWDARVAEPSVGARWALSTEDTSRGSDFTFRIQAGSAWDVSSLAIPHHTWTLTALGSATVGPLRFGMIVPMVAVDAPGLFAPPVAADPQFDLRVRAALPGVEGLGLAFVGRVTAPSGAYRWSRGLPTATARLGIVLDYAKAGGWFGLNAGWRVLPERRLGDAWWDDAVWFRVAGAYAWGDRGGLALELLGDVRVMPVPEGVLASFAASAPLEVGLSGWWRVSWQEHLRMGVIVAPGPGIGSPLVRWVVEVGTGSHRGPRRRGDDTEE